MYDNLLMELLAYNLYEFVIIILVVLVFIKYKSFPWYILILSVISLALSLMDIIGGVIFSNNFSEIAFQIHLIGARFMDILSIVFPMSLLISYKQYNYPRFIFIFSIVALIIGIGSFFMLGIPWL
jgi:hypothetical protein